MARAKPADIALMINGHYILTGAAPILVNNVTYIPLRNLFENIDFTVVYYKQYKSAVAWYKKGSFRLAFSVDSNDVEIETTFIESQSATVKISGKPILHNGSFYVPIRAFAELFKADVRFDKYTNQVIFNSKIENIKKSIFPLVGLSLTDPKHNPNSGMTNLNTTPVSIEQEISDTQKPLSAKEIAKLMDRVGTVVAYDNNKEPMGLGSGFVIDGGMFITNYHVIKDSRGIIVKLDGMFYDNKGWYAMLNENTDLFGTYLSTEYSNEGRPIGTMPTKTLPYNITIPEVGDKIYAIGSPQGLENTLSEGIVSGIRNDNGITLIQHTADTDLGSSGGVLINEYGEVIGVTSSGFEGTNLDFAIPIKYVIDEIK